MINPAELVNKYKSRERSTVIVDILKEMEAHDITLAELEKYRNENVIHLREQVLNLKKRSRRGLSNVIRRGKAE